MHKEEVLKALSDIQDFLKNGHQLAIYPFKKDVLRLDDIVYVLSKKIEATVAWDENYKIECPDLSILVWGETRDEAEDAFAFAFHALYLNYAKESDSLLSPKSQILKQKLTSLVKLVINEAP